MNINWQDIDIHVTSSPLYQSIAQKLDSFTCISSIQADVVEDVIEIKGKIQVLQFSHECTLMFHPEHNQLRATCSCNLSHDASFCIHTLFIVHKLKELKPTSFPFLYEDMNFKELTKLRERFSDTIMEQKLLKATQKSRNFLQSAKENYQKEIRLELVQQQYELQPTLEIDSYGNPLVTYRVGSDKFYVIRSIEEFMDRVDQQSDFSYGKNLSFIHQEKSFDEFSREQIQFLRYMLIMNKANFNPYDYYNTTSKFGRYLPLDNTTMDAFFDMYYEHDTDSFQCTTSLEKLHIELIEKKDVYVYSWNPKHRFYKGSTHFYTITKVNSQFKIQRYGFDPNEKTSTFLQMLEKEDLVILKSEYKEFYKYVIQPLIVFIDIDTPSSMVDETYDQIRLYADIDDIDQVFIRLKCYNEFGKYHEGFDERFTTSFSQDIIEETIKQYAIVIDYDAHIAYLDSQNESTFRFICDELAKLSEYCTVFVSDALKKISMVHKYTISVGVRLKNDLLEVDVNSPDIPKSELSDVLKAYRKKRKFYRLKNGQLLNLNSEDIHSLDQFVQDYNIPTQDISSTSTMPAYRMFAMDEIMQDQETNLLFERDKHLKDVLQRWDKKDDIVSLPKEFEPILRQYQKEGFHWLYKLNTYGFHGILADDMGLGKTIQVISLLVKMKGNGTSIVIAPASLLYNWEEEIHKFTKNLRVCCISGSVQERAMLIKNYQAYDVLITSYDYIRRDIEAYEDIQFYYVIIDEAQYIKNQKTKNAVCVKKLQATHRLALTGTPIENSLAELWSIFDFLMPNYLYNYHYFQSHYENDIVKNNDESKQLKLKKLVTPFILRRNKKEVLTELPEKIEKNYVIDFSEEESKLYFAHLAQVNQELQALSNMEGNDKIIILAMLTKLRQLCCDPRLLFENIDIASSKLQACLELIQELRDNNQKVLLFSSFTSMLGLIGEELSQQGISYYTLTGQTSKEERKELVAKFQSDDTSVFLISLKAGGTGLNLTAAQAVIHFDPWWNQSAQNQATDRAHRIGQKQTLQVFKLIMKNSIEEKIQNLQKMKKDLADMFVENNEGSISKMSKQELLDLFKI